VLTGGNDGTLRVWRSGTPQGEIIRTGQGRILGLVRLADERHQQQPQLVSASDDGTFRIFLRPEIVIREACLQLRQHPALVSPKSPAEREARRTCRDHHVF
jgi:WD40 repeat protein